MYSKYLISEHASVLDALKALNTMGRNEALTLFVKGKDGQIIGTLTDGDVRRSLINGKDLFANVKDIANVDFTYLESSSYDVLQIHAAKEKGIELLPVLNEQMQIVDVVNLKKQKSYLPIDAVLEVVVLVVVLDVVKTVVVRVKVVVVLNVAHVAKVVVKVVDVV